MINYSQTRLMEIDSMPSFDIVSNIDQHEMTNAVDQANREVSTRFDFKDSNARLELSKDKITIIAPTDFQLKQVDEILRNKLTKRQVDIRSLDYKEPTINLNEARQLIEVKQGIDTDNAKKVIKLIKDAGLKVQAAIQGDQIRVTGKKRDDLQEVIAMLRAAKVAIPLQFMNFRD
jgi:cyclic-di-GMP-binding protein